MKRDLRKLKRVREAALLIQRAKADGWKCLATRPGAGLVCVLMESRKPGWCNGRLIFHFWQAPDGWRLEVMSRFLDPRGIKRQGLPKAWAVFFSLKEVAS